MAAKRTFAAWAAIVLLGFDIAAEGARLAVCVSKPEAAASVLCADPIGPISRLVSRMAQLLSEEPPPHVEPPPPPPPPLVVPKGGSTMERLRQAESL